MGEQAPNKSEVNVVIDGLPYRVHAGVIRAAQLRAIPHPPIGHERDLWLEVPDGTDRFLSDDEQIALGDGMHLFTAPQTITAGGIIDRPGDNR